MMVAVVQSGTGTAAQIPGVAVGGRPGPRRRCRAPHRTSGSSASHPRRTPRSRVAVVVLDGGNLGAGATGGEICAPIARTSLEAALNR